MQITLTIQGDPTPETLEALRSVLASLEGVTPEATMPPAPKPVKRTAKRKPAAPKVEAPAAEEPKSSSTSTTTPSSPEPEPEPEPAQDIQALRLELSALARRALQADKRQEVIAMISDHGGERGITSIPDDQVASALEAVKSWGL